MADTSKIKKIIEPHIVEIFLNDSSAKILELKNILTMKPDIIAYKNSTLILGEITTSGYLGGNKSSYHQGGVKKINEAFCKFSIIQLKKNEILKDISNKTGKILSEIKCYFVVPEKSTFLSQIGYRSILFDMNIMELSKVKLEINLENELVDILMKCRKEMKTNV